ncbi:MAG: hypothetical protein KME27_08085 [Lyngbya sp. HA4199-MV5]|nr:hypothetical protein [Lyngbya sp. HA4199-MV5]
MSVPLIRFSDLIVNVNCIATVKFSTYTANDKEADIPIVNICLMLPEGSIDGQVEPRNGVYGSIEKLEFEGDLALTIWEYFSSSGKVDVLFE